MEKRHSSPASRAVIPRPRTHRKRSNSFPLIDALGCSTPEAELILAEGRAAIHSRTAATRARRNRIENKEARTFRPQDHLKYLEVNAEASMNGDESTSSNIRSTYHARIPSNITDKSTSTVTGPTTPVALPPEPPKSPRSPTSPLGNYSANLADFIKTQLNSIPSFHTSAYSRSCPDLNVASGTPPQSPKKFSRRPVGMPDIIEIPPVQPPLRSAFSAWSSTDDEVEDEVPALPSPDHSRTEPKSNTYTPSILQYYENSNSSSFLFSSTPLEEEKQHPNIHGFTFPSQEQPAESVEAGDEDYPSSTLSSHPPLASSSAPSFSSASTASYFECKRPISIAPHVRDRIIAAVSSHHSKGRIIPVISPFEGRDLSNVHNLYIESRNRVHVDGMSFDLV